MSRQTNTDGRGKMVIHVRELLIEKFGGDEAAVNLSEVSRDTGMHYATVRGWWEGTVSRVDQESMVTWCWYFGVDESRIWSYAPPPPVKKRRASRPAVIPA